jgi:hypothetical protein
MTERPVSRVVVALDPAGGAEFALDIAAFVSGGTFEIVGLFVEDIRLLEHARSPLAREIVLSGRDRSLNCESLERQIRARAAAVRTRFEDAAAKLGLRHVFQVARGDVLAEVARGAAGADVLVVSLGAETGRPASWWGTPLEQLVREPFPALLFARERWPAGGILVAIERPERALAALKIAARLAKRSRAPLSILAAGAALAELDIAAIVRTEGIEAPVLVRAEPIAAETIARAARGSRLVLLPSRDTVSDEALIGALLAKVHAPLMLIRDRPTSRVRNSPDLEHVVTTVLSGGAAESRPG